VKGKGWGWTWGKEDQVGALNAVKSPAAVLRALREVKTGKVYDLGVRVDQSTFKWPGHSPTQIISYRSPEGVKRGKDIQAFVQSKHQTGFHSCALFISDNVGTQIDGLGHITTGADNHWYNGFTEDQWGGDFGIRKCGAETIPPVIARGVLLDIAGAEGVDALPSKYAIGIADLEAAL